MTITPTIITCASSKGGVGKSTTVACLAGAFAHAGEIIHIVDLDNNRTVSRWFRDDKSRPRAISVSTPDPQDLTTHLQTVATKVAPDIVLIDVAGSYERALTVAAARAHLTIIPATLTEADIYEASKTAQHIQQIFASFGRQPLFRLLLTKVQPLASHAQRHAAREVKRFSLPLFESALGLRAAYEEIGLSGQPPHFSDPNRPTVAKALDELNALRFEIATLTGRRQDALPAHTAGAA
jgi:chromosome partitioning protein